MRKPENHVRISPHVRAQQRGRLPVRRKPTFLGSLFYRSLQHSTRCLATWGHNSYKEGEYFLQSRRKGTPLIVLRFGMAYLEFRIDAAPGLEFCPAALTRIREWLRREFARDFHCWVCGWESKPSKLIQGIGIPVAKTEQFLEELTRIIEDCSRPSTARPVPRDVTGLSPGGDQCGG